MIPFKQKGGCIIKKHKKIYISIIAILVIVAIIVTVGLILNHKKSERKTYDETIGEKDSINFFIHKEDIKNISDFSFKEGDRVNIIVNDPDIDYDFDNNPYMENVLIDQIWDTSVIFFGPNNDATSFIHVFTFLPDITIKIVEATDPEGPFKVNKEVYDVLTSKYDMLDSEDEVGEQ